MVAEIRQARSTDAVAACEVLRRSISEVCGPDYSRIEGFVEDWLKNKTPEQVAAWIENPDTYFVVACIPDEDGVVGVGSIAPSGEILLCYVIPEYLGKGVGRTILGALEDRARAWELRQLTTLSTVTAREFYIRQGFTQCGAPVMEDGHEIEIPMVFVSAERQSAISLP